MIMKKLLEKYNRWKIYRQTMDELSRLSDSELKDIGISRFDINKIARYH